VGKPVQLVVYKRGSKAKEKEKVKERTRRYIGAKPPAKPLTRVRNGAVTTLLARKIFLLLLRHSVTALLQTLVKGLARDLALYI